jgi:hypothetical protein
MIDGKSNGLPAGKPGRGRRWLWIGLTLLVVAAAATGGWIWRFRTYTPAAVARDLKAAFQSRNASQPAVHFLELRYGPLSEPENRQKAFVNFFNVDHMEGLYRITAKMQGAQKTTNIAATAQWIADYRNNMTPEEKQSLGDYLRSPTGREALARATVEYLKRDVEYRSATAPVIAELMATIAHVQKP